MKYPDGAEARMGDRVELWEGNIGVVVCSIDTNEYSAAYTQDDCEQFLGAGVLILSEAAGLIHYKEPETTMRLLSRQHGTLDPL
jgi:hypothetical protein